MRLRTLLAASTAGTILAGLGGMPAHADPGAVPEARSGHVEAWGNALAATATTVPAELDDKQIISVSASNKGTAAVTADGDLFVWGDPSVVEVDAAPVGLTDVASVSLRLGGGVALKRDGSVVGWGENGIDAPPTGLSAKAVSVNNQSAYAVTTDGTLVSWGTEHGPSNPAPPEGLTGLVDVSAAAAVTAALDADGELHLWGLLADNPALEVPSEVQGHVEKLAVGGLAIGVILDDGSVRTWGISASAVPLELTGETIASLALYSGNAIAATEDGEVYAWGRTPISTTSHHHSTTPMSLRCPSGRTTPWSWSPTSAWFRPRRSPEFPRSDRP
ncbi:hypothetical protein [Nocardioides humi]|uniref:hypothetical protein n=1 Tax=Nocardioides humi TaxID=449461 RepID=UPI001128CDF0|nr:hypothetical protein [Nocardioides humi]